jgi:hypothetical protein
VSANEEVIAQAPRGAGRRRRRRRRKLLIGGLAVLLLAAATGAFLLVRDDRAGSGGSPLASDSPSSSRAPSTTGSTTTTTQAPGPGFVAGKVTAVGDSVMMDYQQPLEQLIPGINVDASVSRQWSTGEEILSQLKAQDQLGATVIVGLSTNGQISAASFDAMMSILSGASKVLFVNVHVDQPWQDPNNQVLADGVTRYPNAELVDWYSLASANPGWFGADGTHIAINGTAAQALAQLITSKLS